MKLRSDLAAVVYLDGTTYTSGDTLPEGAAVAASLLEPVEAEKPKRGRPRKEVSDVD